MQCHNSEEQYSIHLATMRTSSFKKTCMCLLLGSDIWLQWFMYSITLKWNVRTLWSKGWQVVEITFSESWHYCGNLMKVYTIHYERTCVRLFVWVRTHVCRISINSFSMLKRIFVALFVNSGATMNAFN
jgi:hypothetical protein